MAQEQYPEAIIEFRHAIKADPKDTQAYYKLALVFLKQGEPQLPNAVPGVAKKHRLRL